MAEKCMQHKDGGVAIDQAVVPSEIFTTMRYSQDGLSLQHMCLAFPALNNEQGESFELLENKPLLERHLNRLQEAVAQMKTIYPAEWHSSEVVSRASLRQALEGEIVRGTLAGKGVNRRLRMSIDRAGILHTASFAMSTANPMQEDEPLTVRLDSNSSDSFDVPEHLYRMKTGYRDMYDAARQRVNATLGVNRSNEKDAQECFDVLMTRTHQGKTFITESSIANVLLHHHESNEIITPSDRNFALLNGLFRQELLRRDIVKEGDLEVIRVLNLLHQGKASLYLCNALRGIIAVTLVS